jgi:hypothetical protein
MPLKTIQDMVTSGVAPPASSRALEIPESVLQFAREQGIAEYIHKAQEIVRATFVSADRVTVSMKRDEYGDSYVDINAVVSDDPALEAEKYSACVERWSSLIPAHVGGHIQLSTSWAKR